MLALCSQFIVYMSKIFPFCDQLCCKKCWAPCNTMVSTPKRTWVVDGTIGVRGSDPSICARLFCRNKHTEFLPAAREHKSELALFHFSNFISFYCLSTFNYRRRPRLARSSPASSAFSEGAGLRQFSGRLLLENVANFQLVGQNLMTAHLFIYYSNFRILFIGGPRGRPSATSSMLFLLINHISFLNGTLQVRLAPCVPAVRARETECVAARPIRSETALLFSNGLNCRRFFLIS